MAGSRPVRAVLAELSIDPDTVLVIRERDLLTLATVGEMVWRNLLGPKAIILVELRAA